MLTEKFNAYSVPDLTPRSTPAFCDQYMDVESLAAGLDERFPYSRKEVCELLGIGESTLSGWLKDGRIPQMAKIALVLLHATRELRREVHGLAEKIRLARNELKVIRTNGHFQVCEFLTDEEGDVVGRIVADNITSLEDARLLASARRAVELIEGSLDAFQYVEEVCSNPDYVDKMRSLRFASRRHIAFVTDYESWREQYGEASAWRRVQEMLERAPEERTDAVIESKSNSA